MAAAVAAAGTGAAIKLSGDETANVLALAAAAETFLDDDTTWRNHSARAKGYIREHHSMESTQADWRKVLTTGGDAG